MKAELLFLRRVPVADDAFAEMVLWKLPRKLPGSAHGFKYRLAFIVGGICVLRYDNETGKGDHRHFGDTEAPHIFKGPDTLVADFEADIRR